MYNASNAPRRDKTFALLNIIRNNPHDRKILDEFLELSLNCSSRPIDKVTAELALQEWGRVAFELPDREDLLRDLYNRIDSSNAPPAIKAIHYKFIAETTNLWLYGRIEPQDFSGKRPHRIM